MRRSFYLLWGSTTLLAVILALLWTQRGAPGFQWTGELVSRVEIAEPLIALTFDDGPKPIFTQQILSILAEHQIPATFFLMGSEINRHPELARQIRLAGHDIGNHSYSHPHMVLVSKRFIAEQIKRTDEKIRQTGFAEEILFRPPYGEKFINLPWYLASNNRKSITWDIAPDVDPKRRNDSLAIANYTVAKAKPGSIILLHVMSDKRRASLQAVPLIIQKLKQQGYRFTTVSELLKAQLQSKGTDKA